MEGGGRGQEGEGIFEGNFEELEGVGEGEGDTLIHLCVRGC